MSHPHHHYGLLGVDPKTLGQLLATKPFKFIVGHNATVFFIHQGIVSRLSTPLNSVINSRAKESPEDCVVWEDIDASVFLRFAQFVYTGAYTSFVPAGAPRPSEGPTKTTVNVAEDLPDRNNPEKPLFRGLFSPRTTTPQVGVGYGSALPVPPQESDIASPFKLPYSLATYEKAAKDRSNVHGPGSRGSPSAKKRNLISEFTANQVGLAGVSIEHSIRPTELTSAMFVGNVKIWVFAERFSIPLLMDLAYSHFAKELAHWTISPSTFVPEFGALIRYVYDERTIRGYQLRELVIQFAACVVEDVLGLAGWLELLDEVPKFAADLIHQMTNRFG
ncbi:hypothetical protein B0H63DRAFT_556738 [Podospora didyma]|uniref:BTB domain-containing protein n=1 Tax=Podospora didyma TaxID=330526 RepID=A0AAE0NXH7_9PEZI|nr:hypothetical protein B0H63DRAFT_556738 [Podospora didyma]